MGILVLIVFNAVILAGESIANTMGLGFAVMNDPQNGITVPTISQFYLLMATLLFLVFNGHHAILRLVALSFELLPVGRSLGPDAMWILLEWGSVIFMGALSIALPALSAMLTVNLVMGIITRAAPQLNLFSVGFPVTLIIGFIVILMSLSSFQFSFENLLRDAQGMILIVLRG
jgi:flagellar biosynthetic protein FliR